MRLPEEVDQGFSINILPMLDVILAILAFLMVSTLFLTPSDSLPVNLPSAITGQITEQSPIIVTIDATGAIALNKESLLIEELVLRVQQIGKNETNFVILINADEQVAHGKVVAVMDKLRTIPNVKLAIGLSKAQQK
jgi:biopolymer transport protein ExbD